MMGMHYHVHISQKSNRKLDETKLDLTGKQVKDRFTKPYE